MPSDTIHFVALGETQQVVAIAVDSLGNALHAAIRNLTIGNLSVTHPVDSVTLKSLANGSTSAQFTVAGLPSQVAVVVTQIADSIDVAVTSGAILSVPQDSVLPISCHVFDRNGFPMSMVPSVAPSNAGHWLGARCDSLALRNSGFDTLHVSAGSVSRTAPLTLAARPIVGALHQLSYDSIPSGVGVWAPSARLNSQGQAEVYFAGYRLVPDSNGQGPGDLYRFVSNDGANFKFDGMVLAHDTTSGWPLTGSGIENITRLCPGPMVLGGGCTTPQGASGVTDGQVFSAVSTDERTPWIPEAGIESPMAELYPPAPRATPPYPAGEGIVADQAPSGLANAGWRVYEQVQPPQQKFQVIEWDSPDQINWTYSGPVLSTRQLPPTGDARRYSPTITQLAPGLANGLHGGRPGMCPVARALYGAR